jgi:TP901 family phage tail tape measure protein
MSGSSDLRLQVILQAIDKATGPFKRVTDGSGKTARALRDARDKLKELNAQQKSMGEFRELRSGLQGTMAKLGDAQARVKQLAQTIGQVGPPTKGMVRDFAAAKREAAALSEQHQRQSVHVQAVRDKLTAAGISASTFGAHERRLRSDIDATTRSIADQMAKLKAQGAQERQLAQLRARHSKAMLNAGMAAGAGAAGIATGHTLARPVVSTVQAYGEQESAAMQLQASMMVADGSVPAQFREISELAQKLGDRLPGTTADFYEMMTVLKKEGMSSAAILGGLGESAAYLGVQLQIPMDQSAKFAAQMQDATRSTEGEMMQLMDVIQRTFYLGVDSNQMLSGFSKLSGSLSTLRKTGVDAANSLAPLLVMMNQSGMSDGGAAGNAIRKVIDAGLNAKKLDKTNGMLTDSKAGFKLNFADKDGQFSGLDNVFEQLKKVKAIKSDLVRKSIMRELFGDDAETHQVLGVMMDKGIDGYREVVAKMQAQADLRKRVDEQLGTLKNVLEAAQGVGTNVLASIGETVAPELKALVGWLGKTGEKVGAWVKANPGLVAALVKAAAVIAALYMGIGSLLLVAAGVLLPMLMMRFAFAAIGLQGGVLSRILGLVATAFRMAGTALLWLGRALLMNPIGLTITAIATAAYLLYRYWGPIGGFFTGLWGRVRAAFDQFWQYLGGSVPAAIATITAAIVNWSPAGLLYQAFSEAMRWLGFDLPAKFTEFGGQMMSGLANGITGALGQVQAAISGAADSALAWFKAKLGIQSPSRVFMAAGGEISNGAAAGITSRAGYVRQAALGVATAAASVLPVAVAGADTMPRIDNRAPISASAAPHAPAAGDRYEINIHAAPGMDPQAIARAVSAELDRRQRAKGAAGRSSLSDID